MFCAVLGVNRSHLSLRCAMKPCCLARGKGIVNQSSSVQSIRLCLKWCLFQVVSLSGGAGWFTQIIHRWSTVTKLFGIHAIARETDRRVPLHKLTVVSCWMAFPQIKACPLVASSCSFYADLQTQTVLCSLQKF